MSECKVTLQHRTISFLLSDYVCCVVSLSLFLHKVRSVLGTFLHALSLLLKLVKFCFKVALHSLHSELLGTFWLCFFLKSGSVSLQFPVFLMPRSDYTL